MKQKHVVRQPLKHCTCGCCKQQVIPHKITIKLWSICFHSFCNFCNRIWWFDTVFLDTIIVCVRKALDKNLVLQKRRMSRSEELLCWKKKTLCMWAVSSRVKKWAFRELSPCISSWYLKHSLLSIVKGWRLLLELVFAVERYSLALWTFEIITLNSCQWGQSEERKRYIRKCSISYKNWLWRSHCQWTTHTHKEWWHLFPLALTQN